MSVSHLSDHKNRKKCKKLVEDIDMVVQIFEMSQKALKHYHYIVAVSEVISDIETNKTLLVMQQKKLKKSL